MKVVYTAAARQDLEDIGNWLATRYPALAPLVEHRIREVVGRIALWPESARRVPTHRGVSAAHPFIEPRKLHGKIQGGSD